MVTVRQGQVPYPPNGEAGLFLALRFLPTGYSGQRHAPKRGTTVAAIQSGCGQCKVLYPYPSGSRNRHWTEPMVTGLNAVTSRLGKSGREFAPRMKQPPVERTGVWLRFRFLHR